MSAIDDSNRRLDAALVRLEVALRERLEADAGSAVDQERARLEQEMTAVRNENASLKQTSAQVSQRLDSAIGQIKGMLAN